MLVWDENHRNGAEDAGVLAEASTLVKRDRNHPSVVLWGLCNEVLCIDSDSGDSAASDPTSVADVSVTTKTDKHTHKQTNKKNKLARKLVYVYLSVMNGAISALSAFA